MEKVAGLKAQCDKRVLWRLLWSMQESSKVLIAEIDLPPDEDGNARKPVTMITDAACEDLDSSRTRCIDRFLQKSKARDKDKKSDDEFEDAFPLTTQTSNKRKSSVSIPYGKDEQLSQATGNIPTKRDRVTKRRRVEQASDMAIDRYFVQLPISYTLRFVVLRLIGQLFSKSPRHSLRN